MGSRMRVCVWLSAVVLSICLPICCSAGEANAPEYRQSQTSNRDLPKLLQKAISGDTRAQFLLGRAYELGDGTAQDYSEAARWYQQAAHRSRPEAQNGLGSLYARGLGVELDYRQ